MPGDDPRARVKDGFMPETYHLLAALKAAVDPEDVFRFGLPFVEA